MIQTRHFLLVAIFIGSAFTSFSQTNISGPITQNQVWTASGNPYTVTGNAEVMTGITLKIEEGVNIQFNSDYQISVKGTILIQGNSTNPVTLTGSVLGYNPILLFQMADLSASYIKGAIFNGPKFGISLSSQVGSGQSYNNGVLRIDSCSFNNTSIWTTLPELSPAVKFTECDLINSSVFFNQNPTGFIKFDHCNLDSSFINSNYHYGRLILEACTAVHSSFRLNCQIEVSSSVFDSCHWNDQTPAITFPVFIEDSYFSASPLYLYYSRILMFNCEMENADTLLCIGSGIVGCSKFKNNNSGVGIYATSVIDYGGSDGLQIRNSVFDSLGKSIVIGWYSSDSISIDSCILSPASEYVIYNETNSTVIANNNWWGTTNPLAISSSIYDYWDDVLVSPIIVNSFLNFEPHQSDCQGIPTPASHPAFAEGTCIYPNPANTEVHIKVPDNIYEAVIVTVFSLTGQCLYYKQFPESEKDLIIPVSDLPTGMYLISISGDNCNSYQKLQILR